MTTAAREPDIPGTTLFDGAMARKGYALNRMCYSFNTADNRDAFVRDEAAYCAQYGLTDEQLARREEPQRAAADRRRRQHLLPRQARGHPRSSTCRTSARSRRA